MKKPHKIIAQFSFVCAIFSIFSFFFADNITDANQWTIIWIMALCIGFSEFFQAFRSNESDP